MGKTIDERTNEFKQLLLSEDKTNCILCTSNSSIKDSPSSSISASPASTTSHLSEYSQTEKQRNGDKPIDCTLNTANKQQTSKQINIKENKLNKANYALLLNDLENLKNQRHHSSPSTKSSSINSLNQLIKSSQSINSNRLPKQINRSLTFIDQNQMDKSNFNQQQQINQQYFKSSSDESRNNSEKIRKSASTQSQNLNLAFESNLPQSYSAVFNDNQFSRYDFRLDNQFFSYQNDQQQANENSQDNQSKISFKDSFYKKWFLNKFKPDSELNFDQQTKSKKPKLINLKRYSSIDLYKDEIEKRRTNENRQSNRQSNYNGEKVNNDSNESNLPGPSGIQVKKKDTSLLPKTGSNYLRTDLKQMTNPLHPYYLNAVNCVDLNTWQETSNSYANNSFDNLNNSTSLEDTNAQSYNSTNSSTNSFNNYPTLAFESKKVNNDNKLKRDAQSTNDQQQQQQQQPIKNNKKPILLPKLHNEYCSNTNSSHHKHLNETCSNSSTTRSSLTNSSNISSSSSDTDKATNKTNNNNLKPTNNDLSGSLTSVSSDVNTDPMLPICKICHLNGKDEDPLITPCRCSGTMQFIHCRCLMRWLEISKKKSRKPLSCELCQYQYQWHKKFPKFKIGHWQFPKCSKKDKALHCAFLISVIIMIFCALSIIIFFKLQEPVYRVDPRRYDLTINEPATVGFAMLFVFSFCMSLYAQVKARTTLYRLVMNFVYLNQQWYINEYEKNIKETAGTPEIV